MKEQIIKENYERISKEINELNKKCNLACGNKNAKRRGYKLSYFLRL